jgi:hemerythrin-like domain-containing protein
MAAAENVFSVSELARKMERAHERKLEMCALLEDIADSLLERVDALKCLAAASALAPLLRNVHAFEENAVFPVFEARSTACGRHTGSTQRLKAEHMEDEAFAEELTETLMAIGHGAPISNPEALGFMLRGLFETIRRHVAFEREHILPVVGEAA